MNVIIRYRSKEIDYTTQEYEETIYNYVVPQIQLDQQTSKKQYFFWITNRQSFFINSLEFWIW